MDKILLLLFLKAHILHFLLINRKRLLLQKGRKCVSRGWWGEEKVLKKSLKSAMK